MKIYNSDQKGNIKNYIYLNEIAVNDVGTLSKAVEFDHVTSKFIDGKRSNKNFISSSVIYADCDNNHTDNPAKWLDFEDICAAFHGVTFYLVYSRNNMKPKKAESARPRFHVYFPIANITDVDLYRVYKKQLAESYMYFDSNSDGISSFIFGIDKPVIRANIGDIDVITFLKTKAMILNL